MPDVVDVRVDGLGAERGFGVGVGLTTPPFSCVLEISLTVLFTPSDGECGKSSARVINTIATRQALKSLGFILLTSIFLAEVSSVSFLFYASKIFCWCAGKAQTVINR